MKGLVWVNDGQRNRAVSSNSVSSMGGWVRGRLGVKGHKKTHCKRGHEYTPETTRPLAGGRRACKLCEKTAYKVARTNANWKYRGIDLTTPDYERRLLEQGGVCALCNEPPTDARLVPDHDHETGFIRGLIHGSCNLMLGMAKDSPELLELAAQYLRKSFNRCAAKAAGGQ